MRIATVLIFVLFLAGCSGDKNNCTVRVTIKGSGGGPLFIAKRTLTGTTEIDSVMPAKSGIYQFEKRVSQPDFYIVYRQPRHYINLILHPGDDFRVITDESSFEYNYLVEGSKDSRLIQKLVTKQAKTLESITSISNQYESILGKPGFEKAKARIDSAYKQVVEEHRDCSKKLIEDNPGSLASLMALYQQLGRNIPVFSYKDDFLYYELVDTSLARLYPNSEAVKDLDRKISNLKNILRLEIGSAAPAISMPDPDGNIVNINQLKGKPVLLAFWASWSSESCSAIREASLLYRTYAEKGLEYYFVSLDRTKDSWTESIQNEKAAGIQVSDLKYWDSPVVQQYQITHLPVLYLLDADGIIIARNFKAGDLREILSKIPGF
jgi:peroxiredoxin